MTTDDPQRPNDDADDAPSAGVPDADAPDDAVSPPTDPALEAPTEVVATAPPPPSNTLRNVLIGVIAVLIGVMLVTLGFLGRVLTEPESTPAQASNDPENSRPAASSDADFLILDEILQILETDFVEPDLVDPEALHAAAIRGIFDALGDPHSTYIDPDTYALSADDFSGAFQGIGATVEKPAGSDYIVIVRPLPDTPAEAAGITTGDQIIEVDGEDASGWTVDEGVRRIRGPQGTPVELLIRHADGTEELVTIVRDEIKVASVAAVDVTDRDGNDVTDIGYIYISQFTQRSPDELQTAIQGYIDQGVKGLILDVRLNPGGLLLETTQIADMFLDSGIIVTQVDRDGNEQVATAREGTITDLPLVVLQDAFSASGSELLAAALQENGRATVIGEPSFGKGTVNHVRELSNGGAVYVSIARWLTPDRNQIEGRGVIPDIEVEPTLEDIEAGRDIPLFRAIEFLRETIGQPTVAAPTATPATTQ